MNSVIIFITIQFQFYFVSSFINSERKFTCGESELERGTPNNFGLFRNSKWTKNTLTYKIFNYYNGMDRITTHQLIRNAFQLWEESSNLKFTETDYDDDADIKIKFRPKHHEDGFLFNETTLAHAFPHGWRGLVGDIHFNTAFHWTKNFHRNGGKHVQLVPVAVHEIGHVLGLDHSDDKNSLMYKFFDTNKPFAGRLSEDDILGIQTLYSSKTGVTTSRTTTASTPVDEDVPIFPDICAVDVDAASLIRSDLFIFKGHMFMWVKKDVHQILSATVGYWSGLPSHFNKLNAVFELGNSIIFVSGKNYAELSDNTKLVKSGNIYDFGLPKDVDHIDAAFNLNDDIYLFSGRWYWRYNTNLKTIDSAYRRKISKDWNGIPNDIDAAYAADVRYVNFFKKNKFYKFDLELKRVVTLYKYVAPDCIKIPLPNCSSKVNLFKLFNLLLMSCLSLCLLVK